MEIVHQTTPARNEARIQEQLLAVPDAYERMNYLVGRAARESGLQEGDRTGETLVHGCVSQVWVVAGEREGRWEFRSDSDAPMVKAVAGVLCGVFSGSTADEISSHEPAILENTGVLSCLTQSRRAGAQRILERIQALAR